MKLIDRLLIDLDWAESNIKEKKTQEKIIEDLNLLKGIQDSQMAISKLKTQMLGISLKTETDKSLADLLTKTENLVSTTEKTTPQNVQVTKKTSFVQSLTEQDIKGMVDEFLQATNYTEKQKEKFANVLNRLHEKIAVEGEVETFTIEYLDGTTESKVMVRKKASYESPESLTDVKLVELIPKTVAGDIDSLDIRTPDYLVLNPDPIIAWNYDSLTFDKKIIEYIIVSSDDTELAKTTKTFIMIDPKTVIKENSNTITGFVTMIVGTGGISFGEIVALLVGTVILGGLIMYYLVEVREIELKLPRLPLDLSRFKRPKKNLYKPITDTMVPPDKYFYLANGDVIRSLPELKAVLSNIDSSTFYHHVNYHKNDFSEWIRQVHQMHELSHKIAYLKTPGEIIKELDNNGI
jgi:hypothetical protein